MPPLAEPSSLVSTMPVTSTTSEKTLACSQAVLAGGRVEDEQHLVDRALLLDDPLDLAELVHEAGLVLQAPGGVDEHHVGLESLRGLDGVEGDAGGVGTFSVGATVGTPTRSPQVCDWSAAAARNVSAAPSTTSLSSATRTRASLPTVVVLPVPLTPTTSTHAGRFSTRGRGDRAGPSTGRRGLEQLFAQPAAHGGLVGRALDQRPWCAASRPARSWPPRRGRPRAGCPRPPPRRPRRACRGRAGRAGPCRWRCCYGPAARAAAPGAQPGDSGRSYAGSRVGPVGQRLARTSVDRPLQARQCARPVPDWSRPRNWASHRHTPVVSRDGVGSCALGRASGRRGRAGSRHRPRPKGDGRRGGR
jgi:hypothetical protein